ncbi:MAG: PorP/SprF family type IX secretion system membrane protein [Bacteroidetes bacterium]|nr:PorP/SprF family type IX secretion system membrane protein [Bacteroidota bacterium]
MKQIFFTAAAAFILPLFSFAQDIHFSQFYLTPLTQNPSLAGLHHDMQAIVNYKDQWQSVSNSPYRTMAFSYDMRLNKKKAKKGFCAAGVNFFSDKSGDSKMTTTQANFTFAYHVFLNKYNTIGGGLQAGFFQRSISYSDLTWGNQFNGSNYDGSLPNGEPNGGTTFSRFDLSGGVVYNFNNTSGDIKVTDNHDLRFTGGVAFFHPQHSAYSFYGNPENLYMKYVVHGNAVISIPNSNIAVLPGFMYYRQGPAQEIFAGWLVRYKLKQDSKYTGFEKGAAFSLGAFYRAKDAIAVCSLLEYSKYAIGVSYDVNISPLRAASSARGGIEITLRFVNPNPFLYQQFYRQISSPIID